MSGAKSPVSIQDSAAGGSGRLTLVLASSNAGKLSELQALLAQLPIDLLTVRDVLGQPLELREEGASFEANAGDKARAVCEATGLAALADDSGLEVDALDGRPGVYSARFAGEHSTDEQNNARLLQELSTVQQHARRARFRCVLALACPGSERLILTEGSCEGTIACSPRGQAGFGYDPLFIPAELAPRTMAELTADEKNRISHRWRAMRALVPELKSLLDRKAGEIGPGSTRARGGQS
jgi:XTP/dITP diphosphohydrolase